MKRAMLTGLAVLAVAGFAAGCGPAVAYQAHRRQPGQFQCASPAAPAAATWQPAGPIPARCHQLPDPRPARHLAAGHLVPTRTGTR
jgi:hypothetical protein